MKQSTRRLAGLMLTMLVGGLHPGAQAAAQDDTPAEAAAMRCSAISQLHSTLTVPSPQFGAVMGDIAGLFAQVYTTQKQARIRSKPATAELKAKRDATLTEIIKGWPANKSAIVHDAATCNAWRIAFVSKLPEKPGEKEFQAVLQNAGMPPADVPKPDLDKWAALTPQAMGAWTAIKAPTKQP
ncbi:MAG: hypothetical protein RL404_862 [Pseudomonadota bacterium]